MGVIANANLSRFFLKLYVISQNIFIYFFDDDANLFKSTSEKLDDGTKASITTESESVFFDDVKHNVT